MKDMRQSSKDLRIFMSIKPTLAQRTLQLPESGRFADLVDLADKNQMFGEPGLDKLWGKN